MKHFARLLVPLVILAALLLATGGVAFAREIGLSALIGSGSKVEFFGTVDSISADSLVVAGRTLAVGPRTEIKGLITAGDMVKVHALVGADGLLTAREVELAAAPSNGFTISSSDEMEITGTVEAISTTSWTVSGQTFAVTPATEIHGTIVVGDVVKVHLFTDPAGVVTAREIELFTGEDGEGEDEDGDEMEFTGTVEAISVGSITVSGHILAITGDTELEGSFVVGDVVKVHAFLSADGTLTAREIQLAADDDASGSGGSDDDGSSDDDGDDSGDDSGDDDDGGSHDSGDDDGDSGGDD